MSKRDLLVSALVAALCSAILVLFTNIEKSVGGILRCGIPIGHSEPGRCR